MRKWHSTAVQQQQYSGSSKQHPPFPPSLTLPPPHLPPTREVHARHAVLVEPTLEGSWLRPEWLADAFKRCGKANGTLYEWEECLTRALAHGAIEEVHKGSVYAFDLFTPTLCNLLIEEIETFERSDLPKRRPNTMNNYGLVINDIGMHPLMTNLLRMIIAPLARLLYPKEAVAASLDHHHSFIVAYDANSRNGDVSLDLHHDASEVTLNVCLGRDGFEGGGLRFCGQYGASDHRRLSCVVQHTKGRAIIHLGRQRHGADTLLSGTRLNLIVWARSSAFRAAAAYGHVEPDGYPQESEEGEPERCCLSKANDRDYTRRVTLDAANLD